MPIGPVILVDFLYFCIFDPLKHVFSEKKPCGTKWKKWQHGFLCSQYYLGYFKCILQDYSKKYYNISFPYINRWTTCVQPISPGSSWHHTGIQDLPLQFSGNLSVHPLHFSMHSLLLVFCVEPPHPHARSQIYFHQDKHNSLLV